MRITDLEAFTVAIPFRAPLISSFGVSYPARVCTFIKLHTDVGIVGIGETSISPLHYFDRDAQLKRFQNQVKPAIIGENPFEFNWIRRKLYYSSESIAVEIACWDIIAKVSGVPLYRLLGGQRACTSVPIAGYCFFTAPAQDGSGAVGLDNFVEHCKRIQSEGDFAVLKAKLGANDPRDEIPLILQLREELSDTVELRVDPNGSWSMPTALRVLRQLEDVNLQYVEEPIRALGPADGTVSTANLRRLRMSSRTPIAADHCYRMDLLSQIIHDEATDIVLADIFGCGGIGQTMQFCRTVHAFGLGLALHSGTECCVGQTVKLHIHAALLDEFSFAGDAIYPEYVDGVLKGGKLKIEDGHMAVPQTPGLGIELDEGKLAKWTLTEERHKELDAFWDETKASIGVNYPSSNLLARHY